MKTDYSSVKIDFGKRTFQILDGTEGIFSLNDIERCVVLNEKASKKGKQESFLALMPEKGLPTGILSTPYLFVGIRIIMKDGTKLAIYISKNKTQVGTEQYKKDREEAKKIVNILEGKEK
ncbi:hypothetical protein WKT02_09790 [Erysipelotrichaceae bacterium HCN-30851]